MKLIYKSSAEEKIQTHGATFTTAKICRETVEIIFLFFFKSHRPQVCSFFYTKKNGKIRKNAFLHSNLNRLEVSHFSELEQTVSIFVFSIKFCTPNFCRALFPNSKILTIFRIKKVAHVQKTFFECPAGNASRYW